jgi:hypothetical protein
MPDQPPASNRRQLAWCLGLLAAAWGIALAGRYHASRLDLSRFGDCGDVCDALTRDGYIARQVLPFWFAVVATDVAAAVMLYRADARRPGAAVTLIFLFAASPNWAVHGCVWMFIMIIAA